MPDSTEKTSKDLLKLIQNLKPKDIIQNELLFSLLVSKRYTNANAIHQIYWNKIFDDLNHLETHKFGMDTTIATLSHRYCLLQAGMASNYRCIKFENLLKELALTDIKNGASAWKPQRLTKLAMFLIGFAHNPKSDYVTLPEYLVEKIEQMATQFQFRDIMDISKGIKSFHRNGLPKR